MKPRVYHSSLDLGSTAVNQAPEKLRAILNGTFRHLLLLLDHDEQSRAKEDYGYKHTFDCDFGVSLDRRRAGLAV